MHILVLCIPLVGVSPVAISCSDWTSLRKATTLICDSSLLGLAVSIKPVSIVKLLLTIRYTSSSSLSSLSWLFGCQYSTHHCSVAQFDWAYLMNSHCFLLISISCGHSFNQITSSDITTHYIYITIMQFIIYACSRSIIAHPCAKYNGYKLWSINFTSIYIGQIWDMFPKLFLHHWML